MLCFKVFARIAIIGVIIITFPGTLSAWFDETHIAVAKAAGYQKWYNAAGADMIKLKAEAIEQPNHYFNNPPGSVVTAEMVLAQVEKYDQIDEPGHLYGAIIASLRDYLRKKNEGKYGEYHLALCVHYVGDLSQPLHNTPYNLFNKTYHKAIEAFINETILDNLHKIKLYPITIESEASLAAEIARIANLSIKLGHKIEKEHRILTREEAYVQLGHRASLIKAILTYVALQ